MADKMWFNYNTELSMFNKGGYVACYTDHDFTEQRNASRVVFWWLSGGIHNIVVSDNI